MPGASALSSNRTVAALVAMAPRRQTWRVDEPRRGRRPVFIGLSAESRRRRCCRHYLGAGIHWFQIRDVASRERRAGIRIRHPGSLSRRERMRELRLPNVKFFWGDQSLLKRLGGHDRALLNDLSRASTALPALLHAKSRLPQTRRRDPSRSMAGYCHSPSCGSTRSPR